MAELPYKGEKTGKKVVRALNSAMSFIIAYMLIMFFYYFVTALMGKIFGFGAQVYYYGIKFELGSLKWNRLNVFFIFGFGTLFLLIMGGLLSFLFTRLKEQQYVTNLILLWGAQIAFSFVAAQGIMPVLQSGEYNSPFYQNLSVVFAWLFIPLPVLWILGFIFAGFLVFISIYISKPFLSMAYSFSKVNKPSRRRKYFMETVFVPYLIAAVTIMIFTYNTFQLMNFIYLNVIYLLCIGISLAVSFFVININDMKVDEVLRYKTLQKLNPVVVGLFIFTMLFFAITYRGFHLAF
jgi:hypothetical protein